MTGAVSEADLLRLENAIDRGMSNMKVDISEDLSGFKAEISAVREEMSAFREWQATEKLRRANQKWWGHPFVQNAAMIFMTFILSFIAFGLTTFGEVASVAKDFVP